MHLPLIVQCGLRVLKKTGFVSAFSSDSKERKRRLEEEFYKD